MYAKSNESRFHFTCTGTVCCTNTDPCQTRRTIGCVIHHVIASWKRYVRHFHKFIMWFADDDFTHRNQTCTHCTTCLWYRKALVNTTVFSDWRYLITLKPIILRLIVITKCAPTKPCRVVGLPWHVWQALPRVCLREPGHHNWQWASYQIRKIAGCACAGNAGNGFARRRFQRKLLVSDPGMHHGTCVTHVPWCMPGSPTCGDGENVPGIPGACAPAIVRIWQEAHGATSSVPKWCYHINRYLHSIPPLFACEKPFDTITTTYPGGRSRLMTCGTYFDISASVRL